MCRMNARRLALVFLVVVAVLVVATASPRTAAACPPGFGGSTCNICLPGYYGPSCLPCPGGAANPCNGHGTCSEGLSGTGVCICNQTYLTSDCRFELIGLTPTHGPAAGGTPVIISGGFGAGRGSVSFGGVSATIILWSSTQIEVSTPPGSGQHQAVTVVTSDGTSLPGLLFDYDTAAPAVPSVGQAGLAATFALLMSLGAVALRRARRARV